MIFSKESALQQVNSLLQIYDKLHIEKESNQEIILTGEILVNRTASSYTLYKTYHIEVHIPFESDKLPYVFDIGNAIDSNYNHQYKDGLLCLETDFAIRIRFVDGLNLVSWMQEFVEPYFSHMNTIKDLVVFLLVNDLMALKAFYNRLEMFFKKRIILRCVKFLCLFIVTAIEVIYLVHVVREKI